MPKKKVKGKLGEVYTTEDGLTLAKKRANEVGWLVKETEPAERRVKVIYTVPLRPFWCEMGAPG